MKDCFKRVLALILILSTVFCFSGCFAFDGGLYDEWDSFYDDWDDFDDEYYGDDDYYDDDYSYYDSSESSKSAFSEYYPFYSGTTSSQQSTSSAISGYRPNYSNASSQLVSSSSQTSSRDVSSYNVPSSSYSSSSAVSSKAEPECPKVYTLVQLRDLLKENLDKNNLVVEFEFLGDESFNAGEIARTTSTCYVSYKISGSKYIVTFTEYPGDRIVDAYFSGDSSKLNSKEIQAMNKAIEIVNKAKAHTSNSMELEVFLHDYICETVTYDDSTRDVSDPMNPPRNLSVVGGLLDGRANCQGYSDTFYVLASIAGFKVDRMYVKTSDDLHVTNTIYLGGQWLVVDATFDDMDIQNKNDAISYRLFNASKDVIGEYSWPAHYEMHPIASSSTNYFYYDYYDCRYRDAAEMCADFARKYNNNPIEVHGMIESGETIQEVKTAFNNAMTYAHGRAPSSSFFYNFVGDTCYFHFFIP